MADFKIVEHEGRRELHEKEVCKLLNDGYKIINSFTMVDNKRLVTIYHTHLIIEADCKTYAVRLCRSIMEMRFPINAGWRPADDLAGVLTQIDNIVSKWRSDLEHISMMRTAFKDIQGMAGITDAAEACRVIIKRAQEALDSWK